MRRDVRGRVVLVTGASRGIGRRAAERLAERGARLALSARSVDDLAKVVAECRARGAEVEAFPGDLTNPADRERIVAGVVAKFGALDALVNCAGVCSFGEFSTSTEQIVRRVLEVNFFAQAEMIRVAHPHLLRSSERATDGWRPAVVNVASICGRWGIPSMSEHCASKHAFVGLTEALRGEFERFGIDVLLVLPGLVRSDDLNRHLLRNEGKIYLDFEGAQPPDEVARDVVKSLERNRAEATSGWVSWGVWLGRRLFPRAVRFFMTRKVWKFARRERVQLARRKRDKPTSNRTGPTDTLPEGAEVLMTAHVVRLGHAPLFIGRVECDEVRPGDEVIAVGERPICRGVVGSVERFNEVLPSAHRGDEVGVLVNGWADFPLNSGVRLFRVPLVKRGS